jgi:hypothetical protein
VKQVEVGGAGKCEDGTGIVEAEGIRINRG